MVGPRRGSQLNSGVGRRGDLSRNERLPTTWRWYVIWIYLLLLIAGLLLTARLLTRRSWQTCTAAAGTLVAGLAVLGGFSIGIYLAAVAAMLLIVAGSQGWTGAT